jgi:hypothetical protein
MVQQWKKEYNHDIQILLSTHEKDLKTTLPADTTFFIDEKTNLPALSQYLMNAETNYFAFFWQGSIISDNLFELIYSFYPKIIKERKTHNSGYLLLERDDAGHKYHTVQTFEPEESFNWVNAGQRIHSDTITGNHTYFYASGDEWGTTIEIPVDNELQLVNNITVVSDILFEEKIVEILVVITTFREGKTHLYHVSKADKFALASGQWYRAAVSVQKPELKEGDVIRIYFWNKNKAQFHIDNLKVMLENTE